MKFLSEKSYHLFFRIGVIIKLIQSAIELVFGFLFIFISYESFYKVAIFITGDELIENQADPIWNYVIHAFQDFSATPRMFWVFLFLSHATVKLFLVWGLLREKLWAYPLSAAIFVLFIFSQLYQMVYTPSLALWLITIFDVILIVLILHEYRHKRKLRTKSPLS